MRTIFLTCLLGLLTSASNLFAISASNSIYAVPADVFYQVGRHQTDGAPDYDSDMYGLTVLGGKFLTDKYTSLSMYAMPYRLTVEDNGQFKSVTDSLLLGGMLYLKELGIVDVLAGGYIAPSETEYQRWSGGRIVSTEDQDIWSAYLGLQRVFNVKQVALTPRLIVSYSDFQNDGYTERGSTGNELYVAPSDRQSLVSTVGIDCEVMLTDQTALFLQEDWGYEFKDQAARASARSLEWPELGLSSAEPFDPGRHTFTTTVGLRAQLIKHLRLQLSAQHLWQDKVEAMLYKISLTGSY